MADPVFNIRYSEGLLLPTADFTGVLTVTTAGTPVSGTDVSNSQGFYLRPDPANTAGSYVYVSGAGVATATVGFPMLIGDVVHFRVANLNQLLFDTSVSGSKVRWVKA